MTSSAYSGRAFARSARHFFAGKLAAAGLGIVVLLYLVRALGMEEYAAYVTFVAAIEVAFPIAFLGTPWLAARYLPEFRIHAPRVRLRAFCWRLIAWQALIAGGFAIVILVLLDNYLQWVGLVAYRDAAMLYAGVFLAEAIGRFLREGVLAAMLLQGLAQASAVLRSVLFLASLMIGSSMGSLQLAHVALAELIASVAATVAALLGLHKYLCRLGAGAGTCDWKEPRVRQVSAAAVRMYGAQLFTLCYSPQLLLNLMQRWLGAEAAATFGFMRALYEQTARYLPATLLFGLVRPMLVASYVGRGSVQELARNANLAGKLSLFVLAPLVAFAAAAGEPLIGWLSGGKFTDIGMLLFGLMLTLIPFSQRQLLETVAVAMGHAGLCLRAAALGLLMPGLMFGLMAAGLGLWAAVVVVGVGHLMFDAVVLQGVAAKSGYRADFGGFAKTAVAGAAAYLAAALMPNLPESILTLLVQGLAVAIGYVVAAWWIEPFSMEERSRMMGLLRRQRLAA